MGDIMHNGTYRKECLKLHNEFVGPQRAILIHEGYTNCYYNLIYISKIKEEINE